MNESVELANLKTKHAELVFEHNKVLQELNRLKSDFYTMKLTFEEMLSELKKSTKSPPPPSESVIHRELVNSLLERTREKDVYFNNLNDYQRSEIANQTMSFAKKMVDSFGSFHPNLHRSILNSCGNPPSDISYVTKMYELLSETMIKTYHIADVIKEFDENVLISLYSANMFESWN